MCIRDDPRWHARDGYLAGTDVDRSEAFCEALEDSAVRAVLAARGGYGAMRLLERAGARMLKALVGDPKAIVGFSDVTALHALALRAGVRSVHGPMVAAIGRESTRGDELWEVLRGGVPGPWAGLEPWVDGDIEGIAVGGNLALLAALAGTPWQVNCLGAVLFLEDVSERPYRLDRMLTTLRLSGCLDGVRGIVLGDFTDCEPGPDGATAGWTLRDRLMDLGVPVLASAPFGHGLRNRPWVVGAPVRMVGDTLVHLEGLVG